MKRSLAVVLVSSLLLGGPAAATAQDRTLRQPVVQNVVIDPSADAEQTREQLRRVLRQYPPSVTEVLRVDPSLLNRPEYLEPYPALVAFLSAHPEIARNPSYFFGDFHYYQPNPDDRAREFFAILFGGMAAVTAFVAVISLLVWLIRSVIDHRRWLRVSRVQTEVHTKLMDRLTSNEELMAYMQSPAGRRFLESAPIPLDGEPRPAGAPYGRILWSLQVGIVLVALGAGFWLARPNVIPDIAQGLHVLGVIATALGAGFVVSSLASYFISARLGLLAPRKPALDA